ncbi:unnamed protein product [Arabidopsis lyrata]|uniref:Predicted protein n=1 Tax=Arabidopsis lyrata subsp. lyrata TaxID=81972 RepID=D7KIG2_ARALL|nr:predicted protein [Arabidopsis lyrata subsp. lyrata]CAH8254262.1 unnamed protein product [Arabidopsis lyrata]
MHPLQCLYLPCLNDISLEKIRTIPGSNIEKATLALISDAGEASAHRRWNLSLSARKFCNRFIALVSFRSLSPSFRSFVLLASFEYGSNDSDIGQRRGPTTPFYFLPCSHPPGEALTTKFVSILPIMIKSDLCRSLPPLDFVDGKSLYSWIDSFTMSGGVIDGALCCLIMSARVIYDMMVVTSKINQ